jgi:putative membrane protein
MCRVVLVAIGTFLTSALPASAQQDYGPWRMHEWMGWGWGGMWFGPLLMLAVFALLVAFVVSLVRRLGGDRGLPSGATRTAREVLDERYARGEIDRDEYLKRRQDISGA